MDKSSDSVVTTAPPESLGNFLQQRTRWASKARLYRDRHTIGLALLVIVTNVSFLLSIGMFLGQAHEIWLVCMFSLKIITDCLVLTVGLSFFGRIRHMFLFPFAIILYPFYATSVFVHSLFGTYRWKGRNY